jgi:PEGA domain
MVRTSVVAAIAALCLSSASAFGQPSDPRVAEAKDHFDRGLALTAQRSWDAALAEFLRSRELFPRASSTVNAANCLRELHRYDEALDLYEDVTTRFADIDAQTRAFAQGRIDELRRFVGQVVITGAEGATIVVDGRERAAVNGAIRVSAGTHTIRASKSASAPFERQVEVAGQERVTVAVTFLPLGQTTIVRVVHDGAADDGYHPLAFELVGGLALAPSLGGDVAKTGSQGFGVGPLVQGHAAFQTRFGLVVGVTGGYLLAPSNVTGESAKLTPVGESPRTVKANDSRQLRGGLLGATVGWRFGDVAPVTLRLAGGVLIGSVADKRLGVSGGVSIPGQETIPRVVDGFVAPEARIGYRFAGHFEVSAGVQVPILFGGAPVWDPAKVGQINVPSFGLAAYGKETLAAGAIVLVSPTLGVRYDL